jgi:hypothetical protein
MSFDCVHCRLVESLNEIWLFLEEKVKIFASHPIHNDADLLRGILLTDLHAHLKGLAF